MSLMATMMDAFAKRMLTWESRITTNSRFCSFGKLEKPNRRNVVTVL